MPRIVSLIHSEEEARRIRAWNKASPIMGQDPDYWRADAHDSVICWTEYGNRSSPAGWEIDHYPVPTIFGGSDASSNLRALHWKNNARHGAALGILGKALRNG